MNRSILASAVLLSSFTLASVAQTPAAKPAAPAPSAASSSAAREKIAVIAFQEAVRQTNEFQRNFADLQKKWEPKRDELRKLGDDLDSSTKALQSQSATLSDAERASRSRAIEDKKKQLDRQVQDAQNDFQQEIQDVFASTASKVFDVLTSYAKQNGYTLVLDVADQETPIMYALPQTDITKAVIQAYNVKSGVPAPPPAAPAPAGQTAPKPATPKPAAPKGPSGR